MAKLTGPIKIKGTIGDLIFIEDPSKEIYVKTKGKPGITKEQFAKNEIFNQIRDHGTEFGSCVRKSRIFRLLAKEFYDKAKEVSFAGRVNSLLFEILVEDKSNQRGKRKLENGLQIPELNEILINFEGNKTRPLKIMQPETVEAEDSQYNALGEKPKWSRPGHTIERNVEASSKNK